MRANETYHYFFDVDGEVRYDCECESAVVEVAKTLPSIDLSPGQIIIANEIQIREQEDDTTTLASSASSSYSGNSFATNNVNNNDDGETAPQISWPSPDSNPLLKQLLAGEAMPMLVMPATSFMKHAKFTKCGSADACCKSICEKCDVAIRSCDTISAQTTTTTGPYQGTLYQG